MSADRGPGSLPERELPPGAPRPDGPEWTETEADALLEHLEGPGRAALQGAGTVGRLRSLGRAGARFGDPADPLRQEAEERVPDEAHLSPAVARVLIEGMARDWTPERLEAALRSDFPDPGILDAFGPAPRGELVRAVAPGLLVQVGAGNVPGTGATALIRGLLVGAPTLLKPGRGDRFLPLLVARAIAEESPALAEGLAVVPWAGGHGAPLEARALARARRVVVYGGNDAVAAVRSRLRPTTPLVVYGPRLSAGVVLKEAVAGDEGVRLAHTAARAVVAYEQRGCVSPHAIWVERGGARTPREWGTLLAEALAALSLEQPSPGPPPEVAAAMRQLRDTTELAQAGGRDAWVAGGPERGWMVVGEAGSSFEPSCLGRTVRVLPLEGAGYLERLLEPARGLLQSLAVEGPEERRLAVAEAAASRGVTRITTFEAQPWPPAWWRHDGEGPLSALVSWSTVEPGRAL